MASIFSRNSANAWFGRCWRERPLTGNFRRNRERLVVAAFCLIIVVLSLILSH